jgi:biotin operon repressor
MNSYDGEMPRQQAFLKAERRRKHDAETTEARQRAREQVLMLAEMRKQRGEHALQNQQTLRTQLAVRRRLLDALDEPRSVPQLAEQTGIASHEVLWYMAALRKRGLIEEARMDDMGDYYLYTLSREARS